MDYIEGRWPVSRHTVRMNVARKYSRELEDPLIEFYRREMQTGSRYKNAMHMYLSFHDQAGGLPESHLVTDRDHVIYDVVEEVIFSPRNIALLETTGLGDVLAAPLANDVLFTDLTIDDLFFPLLYTHMRKAYHESKVFRNGRSGKCSYDRIYDGVKADLLRLMKRGLLLTVDEGVSDHLLGKNQAESMMHYVFPGLKTDVSHHSTISIEGGLELLAATHLDAIMPADLGPLSGRDALVRKIFSSSQPSVDDFVLPLLYREFSKNTVSLQEHFENTQRNIFSLLHLGLQLVHDKDVQGYVKKRAERRKEMLPRDLNKAFKSLTERQQGVLERRFGIESEKLVLREIGDIYQLSHEGIRLIQNKALNKLRSSKHLKKYTTSL